MITDITAALTSYLSSNRGPAPSLPDRQGPPHYGVAGVLDGTRIAMTLTFRAGACYCCMEAGCHVALHEGERWTRLRAVLAAHGLATPPRLDLALSVIVEAGARFFDPMQPDPAHPGEYALRPAAAQGYEVSASERG
ncbi:hypothetical protein [Nannocystis pusilla]|uniref:hypothetical protein n=1 Tax=Nannocystis pusilla TaxID=889268 RepID=UPI003B77F30D